MDEVTDYIRMMQGRKLSEVGCTELYRELTRLVGDIFKMMNYNLQDANEIRNLAGSMSGYLQSSFGYLTLEELIFCFEQGMAGKLGSYSRFDIKTVIQWIIAYRRSDARYQAVMALQRQAEQRVITPEMNREAGHRIVEKLLRAYAETGEVRTAVPLRVVKEMIEEAGLFRYPQDAYERAMRQISRIPAPVGDSNRKEVSVIGKMAEKPLSPLERAYKLLVETAFRKVLEKEVPSVLLP